MHPLKGAGRAEFVESDRNSEPRRLGITMCLGIMSACPVSQDEHVEGAKATLSLAFVMRKECFMPSVAFADLRRRDPTGPGLVSEIVLAIILPTMSHHAPFIVLLDSPFPVLLRPSVS